MNFYENKSTDKCSAVSASAASVGLGGGEESLSDPLVLLQHPGDGPENCHLGLSRTGVRGHIPSRRKRE